jgi:cyclin A
MEISDEEDVVHEEVHLERVDPQECNEFVTEIYVFLHTSQRKYLPGDFLQLQTDITATMTGILMDWLVEVAEEYHLNNETLHLAKHYIDRFLSIYKVTRARLQLVGVAAMLVAAKFEEIFPPTVDDFVYISDNTFSRAQVIEMESLVLNSLGFDLTNPTAVEFLTRYANICKVDIVVQSLSKYLMELTLMDYGMLGFLPSHIALSSLYLSAFAQQVHPSVHRTLQQMIPAEQREVFGQCMASVFKLWVNAPRNKLQAVRLKYDRAKNYKVASVVPPTSVPLF